MVSTMNIIKNVICLVVILFFLTSCNKDNPTEPAPTIPNIEDNFQYNEPYRDSIVALTSNSIVMMYKNGDGLRNLKNISARCVSWSPNKWKILYSTPYYLFSMDYNGQNEKKISTNREYILFAISSPNGQKIAYVSKDTTDPHLSNGWIKVMNADGTNITTLTPLLSAPNRVTWTPDSKEIIFNQASIPYNSGIFKVSITDGSIQTLYNDYSQLCYHPSLSKDGNLLAFSSFNGTANKIMLLNMQNGNITQLTTGNSNDSEPSWSADGQSIVYGYAKYVAPYSWIGSYVWSIDKDGSNNIELTSITDGVYSPCWQQ